MALFSGIGDVSGTGSTGSDGRVGTTAYQQLPPNYAQVLPEYKQLSPVYENVLPKYEQLPPKYEQVSPTSDPSFAKLLDQILNVTPTALPGIEQLTAQGMNSPLLQLVLGPAPYLFPMNFRFGQSLGQMLPDQPVILPSYLRQPLIPSRKLKKPIYADPSQVD